MPKEGFYKYRGRPSDVGFVIIEVRLNDRNNGHTYRWRGKDDTYWERGCSDSWFEKRLPSEYTRINVMPDKSDIED